MNIIFFRQLKSVQKLFPIFVAAILFGCGGGGGGTPSNAVLIRGTAAAGAPVVGYVSVRDSSANPQPVRSHIPIEANGNYSVDVAGLTAPYAFLATGTVGGRSVTLYSVATSADEGKTINITPFTDLIIRNIAAGAVDDYINNGNFSGLTTADLDAQRVTLTIQLEPALTAMGLSGSIDLLRATFNADNTGLDRFMDVVKVTPDPLSPNVTITNILDAANTLIIDTSSGGHTGGLGTGGLGALTPFDGMLQTINAFSALFATSLPGPTEPALLALFSSDYKDDGTGRSDALGFLTSQSAMIGLKFTNFVLDSVDTVTGIAEGHSTMVAAGGTRIDEVGGAKSGKMKLEGGVWKFYGNQRIAWVRVRTAVQKNTCNPANPACSLATSYRTGLRLEVDDMSAVVLGSAVVTGPGLPVGGVKLVAQVDSSYLSVSTPNPLCTGCTREQLWDMTDDKIAEVLPNSVYTVKLYDNSVSPVLLATYTEVVPVAPAFNAAAAALAYPSITGMVNLAGKSNATLTPAWNIPTGLRGDRVRVSVFSDSGHLSVRADLSFSLATSGTSTLVIAAPSTGTWTSGYYAIEAFDRYAGRVDTYYW